MRAIVTKYFGPTNYRGARIQARHMDASVVIPYPHELDGDQAHELAADTLAVKLHWTNTPFHSASLRDGSRVHVGAWTNSKLP